MDKIVEGIVARKKFVYLCTNAMLLKKQLHKFTPSPYLTFSVHLDGNRDRHDASVCQSGVYDRAVEAIKAALQAGFRVTVNCTLFQGEDADEVAGFLDDMTELGVEGVTISPGYNYDHAPQQSIFLQRAASKRLFRNIFKLGKQRRRKWSFNQSGLFLDFLAGNQTYQCTPWGNPTRNVFGWQKPCYLLVDEGYAPSFKALMEETDWDSYGTGRNPKCANCMMHCGFEPTAIDDTLVHPLKALKVALRGPRTDGPFAPELPVQYTQAEAEPSAESGETPVSFMGWNTSHDKRS
jgi:hopanoid biosynthesis associated radical SAM protein HpnH